MARTDLETSGRTPERSHETDSFMGRIRGARGATKALLGVPLAYFGSYAIQAGLDDQIASANKWLREVQGAEPTRSAVVETLAEAPHFERVIMNTHSAIQGDNIVLFAQSRSWPVVDLTGKVDASLFNEDGDFEVNGVVYTVRSNPDGTQFTFEAKPQDPKRFCNLGDDLGWLYGAAAHAAHQNTVAQAGGVEQPGQSS